MKEKPTLVALIREAECIGCKKCIDACPVDAILGASQFMHTVISMECVGCKLCIAPCPVDCIDMIEKNDLIISRVERKKKAIARYHARKNRLAKEQSSVEADLTVYSTIEKKQYIKDAIKRAKLKKI